ncbi:hypothetical protein DASC09_027290 [Saccharomycopsis crataegensis]|uniref:Uncharacterized protein n=1 Tax=Saccharomycopsis crataegensis TaxID=43959 RepID=A0AAV5QLA7_9ASCO|nr:hypothetical protein DASC09_027290 [Saccharomycopsis crataegensis]
MKTSTIAVGAALLSSIGASFIQVSTYSDGSIRTFDYRLRAPRIRPTSPFQLYENSLAMGTVETSTGSHAPPINTASYENSNTVPTTSLL